MKRALITGITGQDGSYLAELLLSEGYEVHGTIRKSSSFNTKRIDHLYEDPHKEGRRLFLHYVDLSDATSVSDVVNDAEPDEVYNLAAQSHVHTSFNLSAYTVDITGLGALRLLEAIRRSRCDARFYQASSSEMFGKAAESPQKETTPFNPQSPYACAKVLAHNMTLNYRESYGMFASTGILFNHESPRRGETFVTRKITRGLARIMAGKEKCIYLGNMDARRDWGYAGDYVEAMHMIMQHNKPDDFVIATGESHSVKEFLDEAFSLTELKQEDHVKVDKRYLRPSDVSNLVGDYSKARQTLGWEPKVKFKELVKMMLEADMREAGLDVKG